MCPGLSGQNQAGGAEISDTKAPRRGETNQVRRYLSKDLPQRGPGVSNDC